MRVLVEKTSQPALAIELRPSAFWLREPVSNGVNDRRMGTEADVACLNLYVLDQRGLPLNAALPCYNPVSATEYRGGRNRRRRRKVAIVHAVDTFTTCKFVHPPSVRSAWAARERCPERDHAANIVRGELSDFARIDASEAPANQRHFASGFSSQLPHPIEAGVQDAFTRPQVEAKPPFVRLVTLHA